MAKTYNNININQAAKIIKAYKKQGFTFVNMSCKNDNLHFYGTLRTKKDTVKKINVYCNCTIKNNRIISYKLTRSYYSNNTIYINGHV